jgi:hypothetical protein
MSIKNRLGFVGAGIMGEGVGRWGEGEGLR